ncbi:hypothetical protein [Trueperella sp. LYQ143]|uniref:hypothetical protein n=1 Tax=Trueperella sp. LYQ143 TaxID=3391059 RepID=UPI003983BEA6
MWVALAGAALPGISARDVASQARAAWLAARPTDEVSAFPVSDGLYLAELGSGVEDVIRTRHPHAHRRLLADGGDAGGVPVWQWDDEASIDLSERYAWDGDPGRLAGSTHFLGQLCNELIDSGTTGITIHLPRVISTSDLGMGMVCALAGVDDEDMGSILPVNGEGCEPSLLVQQCDRYASIPAQQLRELYAQARRCLGDTRIGFTYPDELSLRGLTGMARTWHQGGYPGKLAQECERHIGRWFHHLQQAESSRHILGVGLDDRVAYSGVAGGLAMSLLALGAFARPIGAWSISDSPVNADLVIYVGYRLGLKVPSTLTALAQRCEDEGNPLVGVFEHADVRRGELPRLGLCGMYELPGEGALAFQGVSHTDSLQLEHRQMVMRLQQAIGRVARTWGW